MSTQVFKPSPENRRYGPAVTYQFRQKIAIFRLEVFSSGKGPQILRDLIPWIRNFGDYKN